MTSQHPSPPQDQEENPMITAPATAQPVETVVDLTALPGRIVDAVSLAAQRVGVRIFAFHEYADLGPSSSRLSVHLSDTGPRDLNAARAVFVQLGVPDVTIDLRSGMNHSAVTAMVPALNTLVEIVTAPIPDDPQPADPDELLAAVDAARAAASSQPPAPQPASEPTLAPTSRAGSSGERAVRFGARFDSTCPACEQLLEEGAPASWLDGDVVHDTCAEAAGIEVYDPR